MNTTLGRFGLIAVATATLALAGCSSSGGSNDHSSASASANPSASASANAAAGACNYAKEGRPVKEVKAPTDTNPSHAGTVSVDFRTSAGDIPATFNRDEAPCTVESMVSLIGQKYFDNTPCHRLTTQGIFVLQCGDPSGTGTGGPGYTVPDENPKNLTPVPGSAVGDGGAVVYPRGTLAMANTGEPNSGGSQFFMVYKDSPLPPTYAVFGTVSAAGLDTLDGIAAKGENHANGAGDGAPNVPVTIVSATAH